MNEFLAELYGTNQLVNGDGEDLEKEAAAQFLVKLAQEEGVDLSTLPDEAIGQLLAEIEGDKVASAQPQAQTDETQEKLADADFLGRAMAHAYVAELAEIEKEAAIKEKMLAFGKHLGEQYAAGGKGIKGVGRVAKRLGEHQLQTLKSVGRSAKSLVTGKAPTAAGKGVTTSAEGGVRRAALRALGTSAAHAAPTALAGAGAVYGGAKAVKAMSGKGKEKKSWDEQFEDAAFERAQELLLEAGYGGEKVASDEEIQAAVDTRALQMLEESGYPVEWNG